MPDSAARYVALAAAGASVSLLAGYALAGVVAQDILAAPHFHLPPPRALARDAVASDATSDLLRAIERGARLRLEDAGAGQADGSSRL